MPVASCVDLAPESSVRIPSSSFARTFGMTQKQCGVCLGRFVRLVLSEGWSVNRLMNMDWMLKPIGRLRRNSLRSVTLKIEG